MPDASNAKVYSLGTFDHLIAECQNEIAEIESEIEEREGLLTDLRDRLANYNKAKRESLL